MREREVTITDDDVRFVELAQEHYKMFAEACEKDGLTQTAGLFRKQQFYAERFLLRLQGEGK